MHVTWNLLARHQRGETRMLWWALLAHCLLLGPWGLYTLFNEADWSTRLVLALFISAGSNALYFYALNRAYEIAPVALVYPVVRSSPILIALWSILLFQQSLAPGAWAGIGLNVAGLLIMASSAWQKNVPHALGWALLAALCTSLYSLSDQAATTALPSFGALIGFITVGYLLSLAVLTRQTLLETGHWKPRLRPQLSYIIIAGLCVGLAYALVIHAMRELPAAIVVAFTNAGIVIAGLFSILLFGERDHWQRRLLALLIICCGLLVLSLSRQ